MTYSYEAIVTNSFQEDASSRNSQITLEAQVQVDVISSCQQTMQVYFNIILVLSLKIIKATKT